MYTREIKIIFTGTPGCGKTTAVQTIAALPFKDAAGVEKRTTTIGHDYAELALSDDIVLRCYGTPDQPSFAFIRELLGRNADGLVILVDNTRPTPLTDMQNYLDDFHALIARTAAVVCVVKAGAANSPVMADYQAHLQQSGQDLPIIFADGRKPEDMLNVLDGLFGQLLNRK